MREKFYITTPIYYVNDRPHIGHVYSTTVADIIARYHRLCGRDVFFLTGTDEHGKKVADAAKEKGVSPQQFVDEVSAVFQQTFSRMNITNDDFIRTTQPRHESKVQAFVKQLRDSGDVYLGEYEGWYDEGQEEYVTETNAAASDYKSPVSNRPLTRVKEQNYFFALSRYRDKLVKHIEAHPRFIQPDARRNEVLGRLRDEVKDVAISRTTEPWGVPMPDDPEHSIYVWIDALFNYRTAIETDDRHDYWPAQVHLIGKEILWFHAVIWPAMHMALGWELPQQVYAHSFWISEGQKMSKSLGNFIDLEKLDTYINEFGLDAVRYYLATQGPMAATDADFAHTRFVEVYNADLANTLGNCFSRVTNMIGRYFDGKLPDPRHNPWDQDVDPAEIPDLFKFGNDNCIDVAFGAIDHVKTKMGNLDLASATERAMHFIREIDAYIEHHQPFKLAKDQTKRADLATILFNCANALRFATFMLWPFMPETVEEMWRRLHCSHYEEALANHGRGDLVAWTRGWEIDFAPGTPIAQGDSLFPRV